MASVKNTGAGTGGKKNPNSKVSVQTKPKGKQHGGNAKAAVKPANRRG
jgi:hypothetical protein